MPTRCGRPSLETQASLSREHPGLRARLLAGSIDANGVQTWMETYARADGGIDAALQQAIETIARALAPPIEGTRHVEVFLASD